MRVNAAHFLSVIRSVLFAKESQFFKGVNLALKKYFSNLDRRKPPNGCNVNWSGYFIWFFIHLNNLQIWILEWIGCGVHKSNKSAYLKVTCKSIKIMHANTLKIKSIVSGDNKQMTWKIDFRIRIFMKIKKGIKLFKNFWTFHF